MKNNVAANIEKLIFILLISAGVYTRMLHLSSPLLDTHSWRQTQTAMFARNFYRNGMNIFKPQIDWDGNRPGYIESEFQLYPYIVAVVYRFAGVDEKYGRLVAALFFAGSMFLLFSFARLFLSERGALLALFFFVISPLNIFFSRTFMPESTMLFFSIGALYFFARWVMGDRHYWFWLSAMFSMLSFLVKIPSLHIGFVLFFLAYVKYGTQMFTRKESWIYLLFALSVPFAWYVYANRLGKSSGLTENIWSVGQDKWGSLSVWLDSEFYARLIGRIRFLIVTPTGAWFALLGMLLSVKKKEEYVFHVWIIAVVMYIYVTAFGNMVHSYYQLPLVPAACYFAGKGCDKIIEIFRENIHCDRRASYGLLGAVLVYCCLMSYVSIYPEYRVNDTMWYAARDTNRLTTSDTLIIACDFSFPEVLYYSDRKGWHVNPRETKPESLDPIIKMGAKILVISEAQFVFQDAAWKAYLEQKTLVQKGQNYAIYRL